MKKLFLRVDLSLYNSDFIPKLKAFFEKFFKSVTILDIQEQRKEIHAFVETCPHKVISLDKYIPLEHNIDISRVFDIDGKYAYHNLKLNGRIASKEHVIIYDHDRVGGYQIKLLTAVLEERGCTIETKFFLDFSNYEAPHEIIDLDDFINQGLVVDFNGVTRRVPYYVNPEILESRASIPRDKYFEFKFELISLLATHNKVTL